MSCGSCKLWVRRKPKDSLGNWTGQRSGFGYCRSPLHRKPWPYWRTCEESAVMTHETHGVDCPAARPKP